MPSNESHSPRGNQNEDLKGDYQLTPLPHNTLIEINNIELNDQFHSARESSLNIKESKLQGGWGKTL